MTIGLDEIKDHIGHDIECLQYEEDHNYAIVCDTCHMILFEWDSELYGEPPVLPRDEVDNKVHDSDENRYLSWVGFIEEEDEDVRKVGYYGKFCKTKKGVLGSFKVMLNNTSPYKLIMIDTKPLRESRLSILETLNDECFFAFEEKGKEEKGE